MQAESIHPGSNVIIVDDLIATGWCMNGPPSSLSYLMIINATGGSAKAAGELVAAQGGKTLEYVFIVGLPFLKGHEKLDAPIYTIVDAED